MLENAPTLAIVALHTDENEPSRIQIRNNKITLTRYLRRSNRRCGRRIRRPCGRYVNRRYLGLLHNFSHLGLSHHSTLMHCQLLPACAAPGFNLDLLCFNLVRVCRKERRCRGEAACGGALLGLK